VKLGDYASHCNFCLWSATQSAYCNRPAVSSRCQFLPRGAMHNGGLCRHAVSVCLSVTFVHSVEKNKHIFKIFHHRIPHHYTFSVPNVMAIFRQDPPNGSVECRWGGHKSRISTNSWLSPEDCCSANNNCDRPPCSLPHRLPRISESMFITTGWTTTTKRRQQNRIYLYAAINLKRK